MKLDLGKLRFIISTMRTEKIIYHKIGKHMPQMI